MQRPASRLLSIGVAFAFVAACAAAPKKSSTPPAHEAAESESDAGADETAAEEDDSDGEAETEDAAIATGPCPRDMVLVADRVCVDKYEGSLVEVFEDGSEKPYPHYLPVDGHVVRAVSQPGVMPQGFISEVQAEDACAASGKRLCTHVEWKAACMGPEQTTFPYGNARQPGACHDTGKSAVGAVFGAKALADPVVAAPAPSAPVAKQSGKRVSKGEGRRAHVTVKGRAAESTRTRPSKSADRKQAGKKDSRKDSRKGSAKGAASSSSPSSSKPPRRAGRPSTKPASVEASVWTKLNDPKLGQVEGALSETGSHPSCVNGYGVFDMVGNLHEWVATDPAAPHGTFAGGYYLDTSINGDGCNYRTVAHAHDYHDYSTGFRCCRAPSER